MNTTADAISNTPPSQSTLRRRWNTGILPIFGSSSASAPSAERHVDPEDHRPVQMFGEHAAEHRPADTGRHPHAAEIGLVLAALARGHHVGNHGLHDRHDAAAAEPLQAAREDQHRHVRRHRAQHRARDEQAERSDDHGAAAIDVAERAEHRRHRGRGQQIGRDHPGEIGDVVELAADGRQRGRDDGLVERGQEHRQHQAHQDGADLVLASAARAAQSAAHR